MSLHDLTLRITPKMVRDAQGNEKKALVGHLGTHFDVMDKEFPLEYCVRPGVAFDVSTVADREIGVDDVDLSRLEKGMFVAFRTGFIEEEGYGSRRYFTEHPQLSVELLERLMDLHVSMVGVDFAGVRRGREHTPMDQRLVDQGIFVVENLYNLQESTGTGAYRESGGRLHVPHELRGNDGAPLPRGGRRLAPATSTPPQTAARPRATSGPRPSTRRDAFAPS
ncbi:cyclase family protein [Olsenella sp. Marseille-P4559]|uniref:cyclase family protein n=1 Tax=Olsenella sp. Marseille-P4559 TaxID=2364795 RepID=UPI001A92B9E1|nr:cyclase family protein [Olsenella sp. Marseille-P4559]